MPYLEWTNKAKAVADVANVPYHLLRFERGYGDANGNNLLIRGDNLLALKALLPFYRGQVKCIYIDPPYNTQSAFEHYDDRLEHSQWLSLMYPRLVLLRELLAEDGSIWVTIDDNEAHYLKVLMDEIFGRKNFVRNVVWQKKYTVASDSKGIPDSHDHIFVFRKSEAMQRGLLARSDKQNSLYKYDNNDGFGCYRTDNLSVKTYSPDYDYDIENPNTGKKYRPPKGRCWMTNREKMTNLIAGNRVFFGKNGEGAPQLKRYLNEVQQGLVPTSWWAHEEVGHNDESRKEIKKLSVDNFFSTPKPERLIERILQIATNPSDLILDSFLGSGTTAAVAHKMGRRYIGIEMGEHAETHCIPRLQKVIDGEQGGISQAVNWQGGGGFRYYTLADPVFLADGSINPAVRFPALAAYLWHFDTEQAASQTFDSPFLGEHHGKAYYLLYNGILGDRTPQGGNVLTAAVLAHLLEVHPHPGPKVIYGVMTRLGTKRLMAENIEFKQIPYDVRVR